MRCATRSGLRHESTRKGEVSVPTDRASRSMISNDRREVTDSSPPPTVETRPRGPMPVVTLVIGRLYEVFSRYDQPVRSHWSPYSGITDADVDHLYARPLPDLTADDLETFASHALTVWGDSREFRHYLPRLFELLVRVPHWTDADLLLAKLQAADWSEWPQDERMAVLSYFSALWNWSLDASTDQIVAKDVLRGVGLAGENLGPYLERWRQAVSYDAAQQLALLVIREARSLEMSHSVGASWHPKDRELVSAFLLAPETLRALEETYSTHSSRLEASDIADAADILRPLLEHPRCRPSLS